MGVLAAVWGIVGVLGILGFAVWRLTPFALGAFDYGFGVIEWVAFVVWMIFMIYSEGVRGFHQAFAPRVVARAQALARDPRPLNAILAPFFCFGFFHATRKRMIVSWVVTCAIVCLVLLVRLLEQPWRGIVDSGVVSGLVLGMGSILYYGVRLVSGRVHDYPPDLPVAKDSIR